MSTVSSVSTETSSSIMEKFSSLRRESEEIRPNIFVHREKDCPDFRGRTMTLITHIEANPIGRRLFEKINRCVSQIYICHGKTDATHFWHADDAVIYPVQLITTLSDSDDGGCVSMRGEKIPHPAHVSLFHEMVHAYHSLSENGLSHQAQYCDPMVWSTDEEYRTIMGFPWEEEEITENAFRRAERLTERFGHNPSSQHQHPLVTARIKLLGSVHERNLSMRAAKILAPPPIAMLTEADLGRDICWCLLIGSDRENIIVAPLKGGVGPHDESREKTCVSLMTDLTDPSLLEMKKLIDPCLPKLKEQGFEVRNVWLIKTNRSELTLKD